jgi:hypothetical protein
MKRELVVEEKNTILQIKQQTLAMVYFKKKNEIMNKINNIQRKQERIKYVGGAGVGGGDLLL